MYIYVLLCVLNEYKSIDHIKSRSLPLFGRNSSVLDHLYQVLTS